MGKRGGLPDTLKKTMICLHGSQRKVLPSAFIGSLHAGHRGVVIGRFNANGC